MRHTNRAFSKNLFPGNSPSQNWGHANPPGLASDYCSLHGASACEKLLVQDNKQEQGRRNCGWRGSNIPLQIPPKSLRVLIDPLPGPPQFLDLPLALRTCYLSTLYTMYFTYVAFCHFLCVKKSRHIKKKFKFHVWPEIENCFLIFMKKMFWLVLIGRYSKFFLTMDASSWKKLWIFYLLHSKFFCKLFSSKMI